MKTKPDLGFWKLWNLSFGFFGVQIAYALQSANVSRIFATIGADPHDLSYFWILPPLMGLIVQPIVGTMSDKTWNRFGRRLPYLIFGAAIAVLVMCLLPNAGSFGLTISSAILVGLFALMLLDTSINMAMQPFKMLVGDMVNEKQKGLAYSIQSFLCNAGSIVGYIFPFVLTWIGFKSTAPDGVVPETVIYSFYIGAAILLVCVIYSLAKIKEWPPQLYAEYNGINQEKKEKTNVIKLLVNAPKTFWTVGLVQFFCWFAFLFMWTYTNGTVAKNAFDTPEIEKIAAINDGSKSYSAKYLLINDTVKIVENGQALVEGVEIGGVFHSASTVALNGDTIVNNHFVVFSPATGKPLATFGQKVAQPSDKLVIDGVETGYKASASIQFVPVITSLATPTVTQKNTAKGIQVNWNKIDGAESYVVYRSVYSGGKWSKWASIKKGVTGTSYVDGTVKLGTSYKYTVRAVNGSVMSGYQNTKDGAAYNVTPTVKVALAAKGIKVSWSTAANATGYTVYRMEYNTKTKKWSGWKKMGTAKASKTNWTDKSAKKGVQYKYTVKAVYFNDLINITQSNTFEVSKSDFHKNTAKTNS